MQFLLHQSRCDYNHFWVCRCGFLCCRWKTRIAGSSDNVLHIEHASRKGSQWSLHQQLFCLESSSCGDAEWVHYSWLHILQLCKKIHHRVVKKEITLYWYVIISRQGILYYRCNNYVASKVYICANAWTWRHRQTHINCLMTQGST